MSMIRQVCLAGIVLGLAVSSVHAAVTIQCIDTGTPSDGTRQMTGWHGVIVRAISDSGPITRVDLGSSFPGAKVYGDFIQRWIDPTGNAAYYPFSPVVQRSPGFLPNDNSTPSDFNFDSHLLGDPTHFNAIVVPNEQNSYNRYGPNDFGFYTRTPIPSDSYIGYGSAFPAPTLDFFALGNGARLWGVYDVLPQFQTNVLDIAYLVTDAGFAVQSQIYVNNQPMEGTGGFVVPEPSVSLALMGLGVCSRRRRTQLCIRCTTLEPLEQRRLFTDLSVTTPRRSSFPAIVANVSELI